MTDGISNNLKSTLAYQIAAKLDAQDGADGQISKSIWDGFVADKGGGQIKESISLKEAINFIATNLVRQAKTAGKTVEELAKEWLGKLNSGEVEKNTQQTAMTPPTKAPISEVPQKKTFPPEVNIPENDPNPPIMSDQKMKGKPNSVVKEKDGTTYCYDSDGRLESIENSKGQEIQRFRYNDDGSIDFYSRDEYDAKGNNTRSVYYTPKGVVDGYTDKTYNSDNLETSYICKGPDGRVHGEDVNGVAYELEYNAENKKTRKIFYNSDGSVYGYNDYEYDANGKENRTIHYHGDGSVRKYYDVKYDVNRNERYDVEYDANGNATGVVLVY